MADPARTIDGKALAFALLAAIVVPPLVFMAATLAGGGEGVLTRVGATGFMSLMFSTLIVLLAGFPMALALLAYGWFRAIPLIALGALVPAIIGWPLVFLAVDGCVLPLFDGRGFADCQPGVLIYVAAGALSAAAGYFTYRVFERRPAGRAAAAA